MPKPDISKQQLLDRFVYAKNIEDTEYRITLEAIRSALVSCKKGIKYEHLEGAIIFYTLKDTHETMADTEQADSKMNMKIFVLGEKQLEKSLFKTTLNLKDAQKILEKITRPRKYNSLNHYSWFRQNYKTKVHYFLNLKDQTVKEDSSNKTDEKIFSSENLTEALVIPIPVLSTPTILVFLDLAKMKDDTKSVDMDLVVFVREVQRRTAEVVNYHITRKLLSEFTSPKKVGSSGTGEMNGKHIEEITEEPELVKKFANNLSNVLLPINYTIVDSCNNLLHEQQVFDWFGSDYKPDSFFRLELIEKKYTIEYALPTFWVPFSSSRKEDAGLIHEASDYEIRKRQLKDELEDLFDLIYILWKRVQDQEAIVKQAIKKYIDNSLFMSPGGIEKLIASTKKSNEDLADALTSFKTELLAIQNINIESRTEKEGMFKNSDGSFRLTLKVNDTYSNYNFERKESSAGGMNYQNGLEALYYILKKTSEEKCCEVSCLDFLGIEEKVDNANTVKLKKTRNISIESAPVSDSTYKFNDVVGLVKGDFSTFIGLLVNTYPEFDFSGLNNVKESKRVLIDLFKNEENIPEEILEWTARLNKDVNTLARKKKANIISADESKDDIDYIDRMRREMNALDKIFLTAFAIRYKRIKIQAKAVHTKELNKEENNNRKPQAKQTANLKKAIYSALKKINKIEGAQKFIQNIHRAGLINDISLRNASSINSNKFNFPYDQSGVPNAIHIDWHFS
jgi:hypothetical protein